MGMYAKARACLRRECKHKHTHSDRHTQMLQRGLMTWWIACVSVRTVWIGLVLIRCTRPDLPHPLPIQPNSSLPFCPEHNLCVRRCVFVWASGAAFIFISGFMCLGLSKKCWGGHSWVCHGYFMWCVFRTVYTCCFMQSKYTCVHACVCLHHLLKESSLVQQQTELSTLTSLPPVVCYPSHAATPQLQLLMMCMVIQLLLKWQHFKIIV